MTDKLAKIGTRLRNPPSQWTIETPVFWRKVVEKCCNEWQESIKRKD